MPTIQSIRNRRARDGLFGGIWQVGMGGGEFLAALLASSRFMGLDVGYCINEASGHFEKQFSAIAAPAHTAALLQQRMHLPASTWNCVFVSAPIVVSQVTSRG